MGHPRVDIQGIMQQLRDAVGHERGKQYWDALRRFLLAKLSKREFDHIVLTQLGTEHIGLHNSLIQAVLVNAESGHRAPEKPLSVFSRVEVKKRPNNRVHLKQKKATPHKVRKYQMLDQSPGVPDNRKHPLQLSSTEDKREAKRKKRSVLGKPDSLRSDRRGGTRSPAEPRMGGSRVAANSSLRPRHSYSGLVELEPTEVAYEVRQQVASIGMNVTQESVEYLRFAMQATVNRIIDACTLSQVEHSQAKNRVITLVDLERSMADLTEFPGRGLPPWLLSKLFEKIVLHCGRACTYEDPMMEEHDRVEEYE